MSFRSVVAGFVGASEGGPHRECRQCGTTVDEAVESCPECGSDEIAVYELLQ